MLTEFMDIVEPCISWVPIFWGRVCRLFTQTRDVDLPYDIILDILSRLPAELVFQCRDFCRTLSDLTSSPSFINMHVNRATSVIVTQCDSSSTTFYLGNGLYESTIPLYFIDEKAKKVREKCLQITFSRTSEQALSCFHLHIFDSCNGLLMLLNYFLLVVWNPITQQHIILDTPDSSYVCGIYFHMKSKEYRVLYVEQIGKCFRFNMLCIRTRSTRRTSSFSHPPCASAPVILNGMLHWFVSEERFNRVHHDSLKCPESILSFDMDGENYRSISGPEQMNGSRMVETNVKLDKQNGFLCLCHFGTDCTTNIWNLVDYENVVWTKLHTFRLVFLGRTLLVDNDEVIVSQCYTLTRYNLKRNIARNIKTPSIKDRLKYCVLAHTNSLVSLLTDGNF